VSRREQKLSPCVLGLVVGYSVVFCLLVIASLNFIGILVYHCVSIVLNIFNSLSYRSILRRIMPSFAAPLPNVVVVLSGKRKSGKDHVAELLRLHLDPIAPSRIVRLSAPIKAAYAREHGLDLAELLSDGGYKERYRQGMVAWSEAIRERDPGYFCRLACSPKVLGTVNRVSDGESEQGEGNYHHAWSPLVGTAFSPPDPAWTWVQGGDVMLPPEQRELEVLSSPGAGSSCAATLAQTYAEVLDVSQGTPSIATVKPITSLALTCQGRTSAPSSASRCSVWIVSDARRMSDLEFFEQFCFRRDCQAWKKHDGSPAASLISERSPEVSSVPEKATTANSTTNNINFSNNNYGTTEEDNAGGQLGDSATPATLLITVRIQADNIVRERRGWRFVGGIDDAETECGLDAVTDWDVLVENNGGSTGELEASLRDLVRRVRTGLGLGRD
jgi:hypothetical protein